MEYRRHSKGYRTFLEHGWIIYILVLSGLANVTMRLLQALLSWG
jgi:hypothetical protein